MRSPAPRSAATCSSDRDPMGPRVGVRAEPAGRCAVNPTLPAPGSPGGTTLPGSAARLVTLVGTVGSMRVLIAGAAGQLAPFGAPGEAADGAWLSVAGGRLLITPWPDVAWSSSRRAAPAGQGRPGRKVRVTSVSSI